MLTGLVPFPILSSIPGFQRANPKTHTHWTEEYKVLNLMPILGREKIRGEFEGSDGEGKGNEMPRLGRRRTLIGVRAASDHATEVDSTGIWLLMRRHLGPVFNRIVPRPYTLSLSYEYLFMIIFTPAR